MDTFIAVALTGALAGTAVFVFLAGFRAWLRHQLRLALLARLERTPPAPGRETAVEQLLRELEPAVRPPRQDYRVTGLALAILGVSSAYLGTWLATGRLAVGLYEGGRISTILGLSVTVWALLTHIARNRLLKDQHTKRGSGTPLPRIGETGSM